MPRFEAVEIKPRRKAKGGKAVRPNLGIEADYRLRLKKMLREMHESIAYWIAAKYGQNEPLIAQDGAITFDGGAPGLRGGGFSAQPHAAPPHLALDEIPANELRKAIRALQRRWLKNFDDLSPKLAKYFSLSVHKRTDAMLAKILREGGFTVDFKMTRGMRDILNATTTQNVALIKSIPAKYLADVEGAVMRSVQTGRDLGTLTKELQKAYGVTQRRAALIARDQNQKATAAMKRGRQIELGLTKEKWRHSGAGRHPRPTHVAMNGKVYDIKKGMFDPAVGKYIWPGTEINCRCIGIPLIPGLDD